MLCAAFCADPVQNRLSAINLKAVILDQMIDKAFRISAAEMLDRAALDAFSVKMATAIAALTDVLINVASALGAIKFLNDLLVAKLRQMAVDTASSALRRAVQLRADLLGGKLSVGVFGKKRAESAPPLRLIGFLLHSSPVTS